MPTVACLVPACKRGFFLWGLALHCVRGPHTLRAGLPRLGTVIDDLPFLQLRAHSLQPPHLIRIMENNPVRTNLRPLQEAVVQFPAKFFFVHSVEPRSEEHTSEL